ncbi:MAG: maleylpyruvate isomerase family mycothiol-dependent enzyme [Propionibacteriaceae bacterium]
MNSAESEPDQPPAGTEVESLRHLVVTATQQLLGDTISVSDEDWRAPSRLPGWTRGHVATHLARQADALRRLIDGARTGQPAEMYPEPGQRDLEIDAGAPRSGLELQIDLDTAAGALSDAFEAVEQEESWDAVVELRGGDKAPVRLLPLARLAEVVLHHVDLDIGLDIEDVDEPTAAWLLEWLAFRLGSRADFPRVRVVSDSGMTLVIGADGDPVEVRGSSPALLGWLTGRGTGDGVTGANDLQLPPF